MSDDHDEQVAPREGLLEVGRIIKPHGLDGALVVHLVSNRPERLDVGSVLYTPDETLEVRRSRPHQKRFIVVFAGISGRDQAERRRGRTLWAEPLEDPEALWAHEVIGAVLTDQDGVDHGTIVALEQNPASDLLVLDEGGLVPVRFVQRVEPGARVIADVPAGLFDV